MTLAKILFHLALGLWVGAIVFVSFVVAPAVFTAVPSETAGTVMGKVFPLYYGFTIVVGTLTLAAAVVLRRTVGASRAWTSILAMLVVMLAATSYAGVVVNPRTRALRPALHGDAVDATVRIEFDTLHRRAVQLNALVLLLGLTTMVVTAASSRLPGE